MSLRIWEEENSIFPHDFKIRKPQLEKIEVPYDIQKIYADI